MKNFLLLFLTLLVLLGGAVGWPFYRQHQALQLDHARAQGRVLELEALTERLTAERDAAQGELQGVSDRLVGREAEMEALTRRVEENEAHLAKMAGELFQAHDALRVCEKAREEPAKPAADRGVRPVRPGEAPVPATGAAAGATVGATVGPAAGATGATGIAGRPAGPTSRPAEPLTARPKASDRPAEQPDRPPEGPARAAETSAAPAETPGRPAE